MSALDEEHEEVAQITEYDALPQIEAAIRGPEDQHTEFKCSQINQQEITSITGTPKAQKKTQEATKNFINANATQV
jgi:hypothetical protein